MANETSTGATGLREMAIGRLRKRREFVQHLTVYAVINLALVLIWLMTTPGGFFWPMFPLIGWGVGIVFHAIDVFGPAQPTEQKIEREMRRLAHR
ncbi:MAG TPA: 2TM domain-containing protein [Micromonosporaceae bacterium]|nr:2TM domain-containing protein [Micromonosporaceae bacterium]